MGLILRGCAGGTIRHGTLNENSPDTNPCFWGSDSFTAGNNMATLSAAVPLKGSHLIKHFSRAL